MHHIGAHEPFHPIRVIEIGPHKPHALKILLVIAFPIAPGLQHLAEGLRQRHIRPKHAPISLIDAIILDIDGFRPGDDLPCPIAQRGADGFIHRRHGLGNGLRRKRRDIALFLEQMKGIIRLHHVEIESAFLRYHALSDFLRAQHFGKFHRCPGVLRLIGQHVFIWHAAGDRERADWLHGLFCGGKTRQANQRRAQRSKFPLHTVTPSFLLLCQIGKPGPQMIRAIF